MKKRFKSLDAFRGLCALSVVVFHMHLVGSITEFDFFRGSEKFVEFFFILSGFVLAHGYAFKEDINFYSFMKARFFRLYPLHIFMFLILFFLELGKLLVFKLGSLTFNNEPFTNHFALTEIFSNLLLLQSWLPFSDHLSYNYPSWSISLEFYMYALLFLSIRIFKTNKVTTWLFIFFITFIIMIFGWGDSILIVLKGLSCFFGGCCTYVIYKKLAHFKPSFILGSLVELILIIIVVWVIQSKFKYGDIVNPLLFFCTVLFFAFECGAISNLLKTKPLQYAGKLSYSIYMTHAAILFCIISLTMMIQKITSIEIAPFINGYRYFDFGSPFLNNMVASIILCIAIFISSLTYKYVEIFSQNYLKRRTEVVK